MPLKKILPFCDIIKIALLGLLERDPYLLGSNHQRPFADNSRRLFIPQPVHTSGPLFLFLIPISLSMEIPKNSLRRKAKTIRIYIEVISLLLITFLIYAQVFHESFHLAICILSGNTGKIVFGLPPNVECPGILNSSVLIFWVYCMSPYLFLALPIITFSIFKIKTKSYYANLLLIFIPGIALYDTLNNFFRFFMRDNDFNNLLAISPYSFLIGSLVVLIIVLISKFWMENYWPIFKKTIQERIKGKK